MTGQQDNGDQDERRDLHGPSERDIERFNREDDDAYLRRRKREIGGAVWKLVAGGVFILFGATLVLNVLLPALDSSPQVDTTPERVAATVTQVFDPRTIGVQIDGIDRTVRYIGIEIPQYGDPYYDIGIEANHRWLLGKDVMLEADVEEQDSQGNLLRYVWLDDAMVNLNLVASGLSRASASGPNDRYSSLFIELEQSARAQDIGIWSADDPEQSARNFDRPDTAHGNS